MPKFYEKTISELMSDDRLVGCITDPSYYDFTNEEIKLHSYHTLKGKYREKIRDYLKNPQSDMLYSVFRTRILKKCIVREPISAWDSAIILAILKFGDIKVLNESLIKFYTGGISSKNINVRSLIEPELKNFQFPNSLFIFWCYKHFGIKFFISNFDISVRLILDVLKIFLKVILKR